MVAVVPLPGVAAPSYSLVGPSPAAAGSASDSSRNAAVVIMANNGPTVRDAGVRRMKDTR
jgi:hypothetical protein